jgi:hypothetical protein
MLRKLSNFKDNAAAGALGIHASLADHKLAQGAKELLARLPAKSEHRLELVGQLSRNLTTSETTNLFPSVTNRTVQRGKVRAKVAGTTATPENYQLKLERLLVPSPIPNAPAILSNGNPGFAMQVVDPVQHSHWSGGGGSTKDDLSTPIKISAGKTTQLQCVKAAGSTSPAAPTCTARPTPSVPGIVSSARRPDCKRKRVCLPMDEAIVEHLKKKMHVMSGSATDTYILPIQKQEAYLDFRSQYKTILGTLSSLLDPKVDEDDCDGKDSSLFTKNRVLRHLQKLLANPNVRVGRWRDRERAKRKVKMQRRKRRSGNDAVGTSNGDERNTILVDLEGGAMSYAVVPRIPESAFSAQQSTAAGEERDRILPDFEHARHLIESGCHSDIGKRNENDDRSHRIANAQLSSLAPEKWLKSTTIDSYLSLVAIRTRSEGMQSSTPCLAD